jgi:exopolyphosphatase/guanosine-5'-triphosphate,3'-diphosphate pyrophosphatase
VELTLVKDNVICETVSLPLGSLVLKEKFVKGILPTNKETKEIENYVREKFSSIEWLDSVEGGAIYALGGTARYMARLYDNTVKKENINGYLIKLPMLRKLIKKLQRDEIKGIKMLNMTAPQRLFTMLPGMQFFKELAQKSGLDSIYISKYGLREGYLVSQYSDILANETEQKMIDELLTK